VGGEKNGLSKRLAVGLLPVLPLRNIWTLLRSIRGKRHDDEQKTMNEEEEEEEEEKEGGRCLSANSNLSWTKAAAWLGL